MKPTAEQIKAIALIVDGEAWKAIEDGRDALPGSLWGFRRDIAMEKAMAIAALSVPAAAVVGEPVKPVAFHVKVEGYGEELCFTDDGANSLVKRIRRTKGQHGVATITPLYATLPNEALERSEQATFDIAARLLKERDALAARISQQDAELERLRREVEEANAKIAKTRDLISWAQSDLLAEARKAAFIEAAEMASNRALYSFSRDLRAKAEGSP